MSIMSVPTQPPALDLLDSTQCPAWCVMHSPSDDGFIHYSDVAEVVPTAGGANESRPIEVSVEQLQRTIAEADPAQIVLQHAGTWLDPMNPDEALHLAGLLILAARRAVTR
jgi:hypothetical protein